MSALLRKNFEVLLCVALVLMSGCGEAHRSDAALREHFLRHEKAFRELLAMIRSDSKLVRVDQDWTEPSDPASVGVSPERLADYRRRLKSLGIERGFRSTGEGRQVLFIVSAVGLGISGSGKGYAWIEGVPQTLVENLDTYRDPGDHSFVAYRPLKGDWYLFLDNED